MSDTQWPRYQVFHQARPGEPHENAGTVHAPDAEMALLNARDVFVRRPDCVSLWVVPADQIVSLTAEAVAADGEPRMGGTESEPEPYLVFVKKIHRGSHAFAGTVAAGSPPAALREAIRTIEVDTPLVWWVCPERVVLRSDPAESPSFFHPAKDKLYRDQAFYHTDTWLREIKREGNSGER